MEEVKGSVPCFTFRDIPKGFESRDLENTCTPMFMAALIIIAKRWKQPKYPSVDEWINKVWSVHIMECYSAFKRKEILACATTWVSFRAYAK